MNIKTPKEFINELGPLSAIDYLFSEELHQLNVMRDEMLRWNINNDGIKTINESISAMKNKRSEILKWMEKAIQVVPWK